MMGRIDSRLRQARPGGEHPERPGLGGVSCVAVGDPAQCEATRDQQLFDIAPHLKTATDQELATASSSGSGPPAGLPHVASKRRSSCSIVRTVRVLPEPALPSSSTRSGAGSSVRSCGRGAVVAVVPAARAASRTRRRPPATGVGSTTSAASCCAARASSVRRAWSSTTHTKSC